MTKAIALSATLLALGVALAGAAVSRPAAWVQMTGTGAEARLITDAANCPPALVDDVPRAMIQRAGPNAAFPGRVCAVTLRPADRRLVVEGQALRAPSRQIDHIVVIGDTGCRIKGSGIQRCNDPGGWPFARIAALAAARKPDLVIHVGDYYYRETACPPGNAGCAGSPYGDRWTTWKAELFDPAQPLLVASPWVFARGNHEDCKRGGAGWFRQIDAAPVVKTCPSDSDTFAVDLGRVRLMIVDSAGTEDLIAPVELVAAFAARLAGLKTSPDRAPVWMVTHRPVWNSSRLGNLVGDGVINATERKAVKGADLSAVTMIVSGHVHNFSSLDFGGERPSQLVMGASGDSLDLDGAPPPATGRARVDGVKADIFTMGRFGYFLLDRHGRDWIGRFFDTNDRVSATCRLHARRLVCAAPKA